MTAQQPIKLPPKPLRLTSSGPNAHFLQLIDDETGEDVMRRLMVRRIELLPIDVGEDLTVRVTCYVQFDLLVQVEQDFETALWFDPTSVEDVDRVIAELQAQRAELMRR